MADDRYKILALSDNPLLCTGFANQTRHLFSRLARDPAFECVVIGAQSNLGKPYFVNHDSEVLREGHAANSYKLLPGGKIPYAEDVLLRYLNLEKPDVFWCLLDMFMTSYIWQKNYDLSPAKFCMYFPSDGAPLVWGGKEVLNRAQFRVAMSKYAQAQATDAGVERVDYIPHAIETKRFRVRSEQEKLELRDKWSKRLGVLLQGRYIVGCVGRNQGRKNHGELFRAFAEFAKDKPEALLLCHFDPFDPAATFDANYYAQKLGIRGKLVFTGVTWMFGFDEQEVSEIYALMDIHASASTGEGFGICTLESMASGVPMVITDTTTTQELITDNNAGIPVRVADLVFGTYNVDRAIVDRHEMAKAFQFLFDNRGEGVKLGQNGRAAAVKDYDWSVVFPKWREYLKEACEK